MVESDYNVPYGAGLTIPVTDANGLVPALNLAQASNGGKLSTIILQVGITYTPDLTLLSGEYENITIRGGGPPSWIFANGLVSDVTGAVIKPSNVPVSDNTYYFNGVLWEDLVFTCPIVFSAAAKGLMGGNLNQNVWFNRCLWYDWVPPMRKDCGPNIRTTDNHFYISAANQTNANSTAVAITTSPQTVTNPYGGDALLYVVGGTVSAQTVDYGGGQVAIPLQSTYGVRIKTGNTSVVTYSSNPVMYWTQVSTAVMNDVGPTWFDRCVWDYPPSSGLAVGFAAYGSVGPSGGYYFHDCKFGDSGLYSNDGWIDTESFPETAITVTASVFSWQNNATNNPTGGAVQVYVRTGTVSQVQLVTGDVPSTIIAAANYAAGTTVEVGDTIKVTYTVAPTMAYMNQWLPECVVYGCKIINGKVYAINHGKYSIIDCDFGLTVNYTAASPHFVQTYNPNANPGTGGELNIRGCTFRQPRWVSAAGVQLSPVMDPVALSLRRDGAAQVQTVEDCDFYLSNRPSGSNDGSRAAIEILASANCPSAGTVKLRNLRFGYVDTTGTSAPIIQAWADNATTGLGFYEIDAEGLKELGVSAGGGDGLSPATVAAVYTTGFTYGIAAKTSTVTYLALHDIDTPSAGSGGLTIAGTSTITHLDVRNYNPRPINSDIAGASPITVGPAGNGTAYTLAAKNPVIVAIDVAATTSITITLQTQGGTTRTIYPTGVPNVLVPFFIPVMVGDVLTITWTVAQPTHVWVFPFSSGV